MTSLRTAALAAALVAAATSNPGLASAQGEPGRPAATVTRLTAGGPTLRYEQFRRKIEFKVAEKREQQITGLKKLLALASEESAVPDRKLEGEVPDLQFRLAELYFEKSQFHFFRSQEAEEKAQLARTDTAREEHAAQQKEHVRESKLHLKGALDLYKEIVERFPKYPRMPEVLFALGQSHWSQGDFQAAIDAYAELIRNYKDSPLLSEAWLAFGEYYFNENDVNKALKSYEKAAEDKRSRVYGFALYKQAWCFYNLSDWNEALRKFKATVLYSQLSGELSGENKIALGREAQKDWVRTYAHVGDPDKARFELADLLGVDACTDASCLSLLEQLAGLWFEQGDFAESAALYRQLVQAQPGSLRNPFFQGRIVDLVSRSGNKKKVVEETERLVELYQRARDEVAKRTGESEADKKARADVEEAEQLAENMIRKLGQTWNQEAKKTRTSQTYELAMEMYERYLRLFPRSKFAYEMRFQLGDLSFKLERFDDAARAYEETVLADPKGQYLVEAANDAILAIEEHLKDLGVRAPKDVTQPQELHPQKKRLSDACDRYVQLVPAEKADKLVAVKFKAAKIQYEYGQYDEAVRRFDDLVRRHPESEQAEFAANLVADVHNVRRDWENLYRAASDYLKLEALVRERDELRAALERFGDYAKFKLVQIVEERVKASGGDLRPVAQGYEDFWREFPRSENADEALFNASVAWDRVGQRERADGLRKQLLEQYPKSPLGADVALYVAKQHEERAEYEEAAKGYQDFTRRFPTDPRARDALFNAAVFHAGAGAVQTATKLREEYLKAFGRTKGGEREASAIYYAIARDLDRASKWREAAERYASYAREFPNTPEVWDALGREAEIVRDKLRLAPRADALDKALLAAFVAARDAGKELPPAARRHASLAAFRQQEPLVDRYRKVRIETPDIKNPKPFQRSLEQKAAARDAVIKAYEAVVTGYQQAESSIASLHGIAVAWDEFVRALTSVPCPRGVQAEVCDAVRQGIEEQAAPARESAYVAYKTCVEQSNQLNTFTRASTLCVRALETLAPADYPAIVEKLLDYQPPPEIQGMRSNDLILDPARARAPAPADRAAPEAP